MLKPKHQGGYSDLHVELCERALVTLLRGVGPWKHGVYLAGGLVPRYLIPWQADSQGNPPHVGTTDVDLVLDLEVLATTEAYRRLEQNLRSLGFERGQNVEGNAQHFSWRKPVSSGATIVVDLLCDADIAEGGQIATLPGERRLSALKIPGAHLIITDYVEIELNAELLNERGGAAEQVRIANIVPFIVLKTLAYEDRFEEKDAYDLVYCLMHYGGGPHEVAAQFTDRTTRWPNEPLFPRALEILRSRFTSDDQTQGYLKDGPTSYARFLTDPGRQETDARNRRDAAEVVEMFLDEVDRRLDNDQR